MNHPPAMKTGVSCSKVIAELAVVRTKATIKEMLAPEDTTDFGVASGSEIKSSDHVQLVEIYQFRAGLVSKNGSENLQLLSINLFPESLLLTCCIIRYLKMVHHFVYINKQITKL